MPASQAGDGMQSGQQPLALKASSISSRLGWLGSDARLIVAARVLRSFAQGSVTVVVAIYLGLRGFSLVEIGLFLTLGSAGATVSAIVVGLVGDTFGRRRALIVVSILLTLAGITSPSTITLWSSTPPHSWGVSAPWRVAEGVWGRSNSPSWPSLRRHRRERISSGSPPEISRVRLLSMAHARHAPATSS